MPTTGVDSEAGPLADGLDDLTNVKGIGTVYAHALNAAGVYGLPCPPAASLA